MIYVHIFATSIYSDNDVEQVGRLLSQLPSVLRWNIDLDDIDKILRIESQSDTIQEIIHQLHSNGYHCQELQD